MNYSERQTLQQRVIDDFITAAINKPNEPYSVVVRSCAKCKPKVSASPENGSATGAQ